MGIKQDSTTFLNRKYGRLTVIEDLGCSKRTRRVTAICECGKVKDYAIPHLKRGAIVSCGCNQREQTIKRNTKHGLKDHPLNTVWSGMKGRCYYPPNTGFKYYGGRGIRVCDEWLNSLQAFYDWSISNGYQPGLQLDRIDNNGNYEPSNCRWVTRMANLRNMSTNRIITLHGESKCLSEWADIYKIPSCIVMDRINKLKWEAEKAFITPIRKLNNVNRLRKSS